MTFKRLFILAAIFALSLGYPAKASAEDCTHVFHNTADGGTILANCVGALYQIVRLAPQQKQALGISPAQSDYAAVEMTIIRPDRETEGAKSDKFLNPEP